jgi:hypothetical protein
MSDYSLDVLREIEPDGWRVWNLHQHTKGGWQARLYNNRTPARGEGSGFLSPDGQGDTPRAAILAALGRVDDTGDRATVPAAALAALERDLTALAGAFARFGRAL